MGLFNFISDYNRKKREIEEAQKAAAEEKKKKEEIDEINKRIKALNGMVGGTKPTSNTNVAEERFKKIKLGMDVNQLRAAMMGNPINVVENAYNGKIKTKYFYAKSINRLGNDAYDFEVSLEDGFVVGWKDRRNRGTRDY